jgi:hypothetical protein
LAERQRHRRGDEPTRGVFPRWPAAVALLAIGALYAVLSDGLTLGPRAFLLGLVAVLLVPLCLRTSGEATASPDGSVWEWSA